MADLTVPSRFCGPANSGNGGYVCGRVAANVAGLPAVGDECRVIAWMTGRDGRKLTARSALLGSDGEVLAVARTVWLTVPRPHPAMAGKEAS